MEKKVWFKSTTLQGQIITTLGLLINWLNLPILQSEGESAVSAIFILVGIGMAICGRIKTKGERITIK